MVLADRELPSVGIDRDDPHLVARTQRPLKFVLPDSLKGEGEVVSLRTAGRSLPTPQVGPIWAVSRSLLENSSVPPPV